MLNFTTTMAGIRKSFKSYSKFFMMREAVIIGVIDVKMKME